MAKEHILDERDIPPEIEAIANATMEMREELLVNPCLIWDINFISKDSVDWRRGLHRFLERPDSSKAAWWFNLAYFVFLTSAIAWNVMETLPMFREDRKSVVKTVDTVFLSIYVFEVLVRLYAVRYWKEYLKQVTTWVDWVTVVSFIVEIAGVDRAGEIKVLQIFRHFRPILRLLKETRRFSGIQLLVKALKLSTDALMIPLFTVLLFALLSGNFVYVAERDVPSPDGDSSNVANLRDGAWIVMYTVSTVGYGNAPISVEGKIITSIIMIAGIIFLAIPIGIVGSNFDKLWKLKEIMAFLEMVKQKLQDFGLDKNDVDFIFRSFDLSHDGLLDFGEFGQCVRKVGLQFSVEKLGDMFRIFDADASGIITYKEFLKGLQGKSLFPSRVLFEGIHGIRVEINDRHFGHGEAPENKERLRNRRILATRKAIFEGALDWIPGIGNKASAERKRRKALTKES